MPRQMRIEYPGAWYHVMNRGAAHQDIFHSHEYFNIFLNILSKVHQEYKIEVHSYCLMNNHYHLLLRTPEANLSKAMRQIDGIFAKKHNYLLKKDGPLFRGRYKAILVDSDSYLLELSRYIHLNPVNANIVQHAEEYSWSSYKYFINSSKKPTWLYCENIMSHFQGKTESYKLFISKGNNDELKKFLKDPPDIPALGSNNFIEFAKNLLLPNYCLEEMDQNIGIDCLKIMTIENIILTVSKHYGADAQSIRFGLANAKQNFPRKIAIYLSYNMTKYTQEKIANEFGNISRSQVAYTHSIIDRMLKNGEYGLNEAINKIKISLNNFNN
jgi:putative transposase